MLTLNLDSWFHVYESLWTTHNNGKWILQLDQVQGAVRFHGQENGKPQVQVVMCLYHYCVGVDDSSTSRLGVC